MKFIPLKLILLCLFLLTIHTSIWSQEFITTWNTQLPNQNSTVIEIPAHEDETYNYDVDWDNDGVYDEFGITQSVSHSYPEPGIYTVRIQGQFPRINFTDLEQIISVDQWGSTQWTNMNNAFEGCDNLEINATDIPDLTLVTDMSGMFKNAYYFNSDLNSWNVSNVTDMNNLFRGANKFNGDISNWDVSNVTNMASMFENGNDFNGDISNWNVSNVTDMNFMFRALNDFDGDISNWDVSNVTDMHNMFANTNFNNDISNWDVGNVIDMSDMFYNSDFNQDLSNWDVSNVTDMNHMFYQSDFNGEINSWDVSSVNNMSAMFRNTDVFNQDLNNWDVSSVTKMDEMFLNATAFNGDINNWDVSNVTDIDNMFASAVSFNKPLNNWEVSSVTKMNNMFSDATSFNQDLSNWNVSNAEFMMRIFQNAASFNQNLGDWDLSDAIIWDMLEGTALSTENYDNTLIGWEAQGSEDLELRNVAGLTYCLADDARTSLIDDLGWTINDDALDPACSTVPTEDVIAYPIDIQVFPNPTNGSFQVSLKIANSKTIKIHILDFSGRKIWGSSQLNNISNWNQTFDFLDKGVYMLILEMEEKIIYEKIVVL